MNWKNYIGFCVGLTIGNFIFWYLNKSVNIIIRDSLEVAIERSFFQIFAIIIVWIFSIYNNKAKINE